MPNIFFISDHHFNHKNIIKFEKDFRPFDTIQEHDEELIKRWNSVVAQDDKVWHLGDLCFGSDSINKYLSRLNGNIHLVLGNHDKRAHDYLKYVREVYGSASFDGGILTHMPVHPKQLEFRYKFNIHGHLHHHIMDDPKYINVSCEQINLTPISYEDLCQKHRILLEK